MLWSHHLGYAPACVRRWLACLALMAVVATACGAADRADATALATDDTPADSATVVVPTATPAPVLPTTEAVVVVEPTVVPSPTPVKIAVPTPEFGPTGRPSDAGEVHVLTTNPDIRRPTVYDGPDGEEIPVLYEYLSGSVEVYDWFINPTYFGSPLVVMVLSGEPGDEWAEVQIPTRPIMRGWVNTEDFSWSSSDFYVQIDVGTNTVKVWEGDEVIVDSTPVVTGKAGTETPLARTFVDEITRGPSSAYGPWLLSLGMFSDAINTFGGGLPKVAMHGTNQPHLLGQYASNGCIRIPNDVIEMLAEKVPVGTRVDLIRST